MTVAMAIAMIKSACLGNMIFLSAIMIWVKRLESAQQEISTPLSQY
jgi:hypothetical protein